MAKKLPGWLGKYQKAVVGKNIYKNKKTRQRIGEMTGMVPQKKRPTGSAAFRGMLATAFGLFHFHSGNEAQGRKALNFGRWRKYKPKKNKPKPKKAGGGAVVSRKKPPKGGKPYRKGYAKK